MSLLPYYYIIWFPWRLWILSMIQSHAYSKIIIMENKMILLIQEQQKQSKFENSHPSFLGTIQSPSKLKLDLPFLSQEFFRPGPVYTVFLCLLAASLAWRPCSILALFISWAFMYSSVFFLYCSFNSEISPRQQKYTIMYPWKWKGAITLITSLAIWRQER